MRARARECQQITNLYRPGSIISFSSDRRTNQTKQKENNDSKSTVQIGAVLPLQELAKPDYTHTALQSPSLSPSPQFFLTCSSFSFFSSWSSRSVMSTTLLNEAATPWKW